jgi:hypothetical protein
MLTLARLDGRGLSSCTLRSSSSSSDGNDGDGGNGGGGNGGGFWTDETPSGSKNSPNNTYIIE